MSLEKELENQKYLEMYMIYQDEKNQSKKINAYIKMDDYVYMKNKNGGLISDIQQFFYGYYKDEKNYPCKILGSFNLDAENMSPKSMALQEYTPDSISSLVVNVRFENDKVEKAYCTYNDYFVDSNFINEIDMEINDVRNINDKRSVRDFLLNCSDSFYDFKMNDRQMAVYNEQLSSIKDFKEDSNEILHKFKLNLSLKDFDEPTIEL